MTKLLRIHYCILCISFSSGAAAQSAPADQYAILFGEHQVQLPAPDKDVIRVFMDKNGFYYPDMLIPDQELKECNSELRTWYLLHPKKLDSLCRVFNVAGALSAERRSALLNDSICKRTAAKINSASASFRELMFSIHGYRKKAYGKVDFTTTHSTVDNQHVREFVRKQSSGVLFVEIYWDSNYIRAGESGKGRSLSLFETVAATNANRVGLALRPLLQHIRCQNIDIFTHSLGARVAAELLFNAAELPGEERIPTPPQTDIRICILAPAIGGELFGNYYFRGKDTINAQRKDHYKLAIAYNKNDVVLLKSYKPLGIPLIKASAVTFGNTSLGCDYNADLSNFSRSFPEKFLHSPALTVLDLTYEKLNKGQSHRMIRYLGHERFGEVVKFLVE